MNDRSNPDKFEFIDELRGIAIILVVIVHTSQKIENLHPLVARLAEFGQMGVQLFFVASAFTLCLSFERSQADPRRLRNFFIKRYFRIAPLYYLAIPMYFVFSGIGFYLRGDLSDFLSRYNFLSVGANVLFLHGLFPVGSNNIVPGGWSIGTEMAFYAIFPWLFLYSRKVICSGKAGGTILFLACLAVCFSVQAALKMAFSFSMQNNSFLYFSLAAQLPVFVVGIITYFYIEKDKAPFTLTHIQSVLCFLLCSALCVAMYFVDIDRLYAILPTVVGIAFGLLLSLFKRKTSTSALLAKIGQLSFSIYIFHFMLARGVSPSLNKHLFYFLNPSAQLAVSVCFVLAGTVLISVMSERYVERRGIEAGKRIISSESLRWARRG